MMKMGEVKRKRKEWTDIEVETAIQMLESGSTWSVIADKLDRPKDSIRKKLNKLGYNQGKNWTQDDTEIALKMTESGQSYQEIADRLNRHKDTVRKKLNELEIFQGTSKPWTNEEVELLKKLHKEDELTQHEIAIKLGRTKSSTGNKLRSLGLKKVERYAYKVGEKVNGVLILEQTKKQRSGYNRRAYKVQSLKYPDAPSDTMIENDLLSGRGCAYARGYKIYEGNSLYSYSHIRPNLLDVDEAKTIAPYSNNPILFKCEHEDCGFIKESTPNKLLQQGFACDVCSKNISYGNLAFGQYQKHFKLGLESEKILKTLDGRRVDFVKFDENNNVKYFVEVQGAQHTDVNNIWYEDAHAQDIAKRKWAKENNILMIEIDMRISSWEYFKEQINNCEYLPSINDEEEKEILKMMEKNKRYPIREIKDAYLIARKSTYEIAEIYNTTNITIGNILRGQGIDIRDSKVSQGKLVRCIEIDMIFESTKEASRELGIHAGSIGYVCNGKQKTAGGFTFEFVTGVEEKAYFRSQYYKENPTLEINLDESINIMELVNKETV